ncbi:MAG: hypothetical protein LLG13_03360 [Bacteroidales bacterium]|nr:hypothetical protein [Bacteroidales bacterium]
MRKPINLNTAILLCLASISFVCSGQSAVFNSSDESGKVSQNSTTLSIGSHLELFVDDYLIDHLKGNAELRLHNPEPREIAITLDAPWEGSGSGYLSVFFDGSRYRMYYKAAQYTVTPGKMKTDDHPYFCCYAESFDGINWYKPILGLYEYNGSKANNIVFISGMMGGVNADGAHPAVFRDENPNAPADAQYKAILRANKPHGLFAFKSRDGIHWTPMSQKPIITDGAFDSQNLAFWDNELGEYRAYWRYFDSGTKENPYQGIRGIRTAKSKDFINWYDQVDLTYVDSPPEHLYTNQVKPYYRAPHILIGFPTRYIDRGWSESMRALPELKNREMRSSASPRYGTAITEVLMMASRDGVSFKRWNEAFIRPGIERNGTWAYGNQYVGWHLVETKSELGGDAPDELSFYSLEDFWTGTSCALRRYTLRIDGFVSVYAPMSSGELITKPFTFYGNKLFLNFSSSAAGGIQVEIQDATGKIVPGFSLEECPPIFGDSIERVVSWENETDLSSLEGKSIRLRFVLKDADLYSLHFK